MAGIRVLAQTCLTSPKRIKPKISLTQARPGDASGFGPRPGEEQLAQANYAEHRFCRIRTALKNSVQGILDLNQFSRPISIINYSLMDWFYTPNLHWNWISWFKALNQIQNHRIWCKFEVWKTKIQIQPIWGKNSIPMSHLGQNTLAQIVSRL